MTIVIWIVIGLAIGVLLGNRYNKRQQAAKQERAAREREEADNRRRKLLDQQENIGNRIYNKLTEAARLNQATGQVVVQRLRQNGDLGYSIIVGWKEESSMAYGGLDYAGYPIVQINLNLTKEGTPINVSWGPYPKKEDGTYLEYSAEEKLLGDLLETWSHRISNYSPYVRD